MKLLFRNHYETPFTLPSTPLNVLKLDDLSWPRSFLMATQSLSPLLRLPAELQYNIFERLPRTDLASLRLVSSVIHEVSTSLLFAYFRLTKRQQSCESFFAVLESPRFSSYVRTMAIDKMNVNVMKLWFGVTPDYISATHRPCLARFCQLPNLSALEIEFGAARWVESNGDPLRL